MSLCYLGHRATHTHTHTDVHTDSHIDNSLMIWPVCAVPQHTVCTLLSFTTHTAHTYTSVSAWAHCVLTRALL